MNVVPVCVAIIVIGLVYIAIMLPAHRLTMTQAVGFMGCILAGDLVLAVIVPNTAGITHLILKAGNYFSVTADMQQAATEVKSGVVQVQTDKGEVTKIKTDVQMLAQQVADANARVAQSEQNVAQMQTNVRDAYRALFDTLVVSLETRNMFPPPQPALNEMNRQLNILANFAFPVPTEANAEWQRLHAVDKMQAGTPNAATPTPINR